MKKLLALLCCLALLPAALAFEPVAGKDYADIDPPVPTETGNKVEVLEIFYYGCPHCARLEAPLKQWARTVPDWAELRQMSALFSDRWAPLTQLFYTLRAMGVERQFTPLVFKAIHDQRIDLADPAKREAWLKEQGVDLDAFREAWDSFAVANDMNRARQRSAEYQIDGVPAIVVDGRWRTSVSQTGSTERLFQTVDALMKRARAGKKAGSN